MKKFYGTVIGCLLVLILIQGAGLMINYQEKRMLSEKLEAYEERVNSYEEKLEKVDTLLSETGTLLENVNTVMEDVNTAVKNFSLFK